MTEKQIGDILDGQRAFFSQGKTLPTAARAAALDTLKQGIFRHREALKEALKQDLGKSGFESEMCEVGLTLSELDWMQRHLKRLTREKRVGTPVAQFPSRSFQSPSPYGNVLILSPWNYPVLLTLEPLIDALAAGNTAVVKPSAYAPNTATALERLLRECFPPEYVCVITGGREENQCLLHQKFDMIFFTGGKAVGREVLRAAAEHLTPVTLELGGKSPCIVDSTAAIDLAAKRIVFGKFLNCGQTCVAPDYILCHSSVREQLLRALCREINAQFGENPLNNPDYGKIINRKHFDRLSRLIQGEKVTFGGGTDPDALRIAPTVLDGVTFDDPVMEEEIFGPILPVLTFDSLEEVIAAVESRPHPLALYLFTRDKKTQKEVLSRCQFGGGCVNDTIIHLATSEMPFGGVGESGMGGYHGRAGFETFSHTRSIVDKKTWLDLPVRYQPYIKGKERLLQMFGQSRITF